MSSYGSCTSSRTCWATEPVGARRWSGEPSIVRTSCRTCTPALPRWVTLVRSTVTSAVPPRLNRRSEARKLSAVLRSRGPRTDITSPWTEVPNGTGSDVPSTAEAWAPVSTSAVRVSRLRKRAVVPVSLRSMVSRSTRPLTMPSPRPRSGCGVARRSTCRGRRRSRQVAVGVDGCVERHRGQRPLTLGIGMLDRVGDRAPRPRAARRTRRAARPAARPARSPAPREPDGSSRGCGRSWSVRRERRGPVRGQQGDVVGVARLAGQHLERALAHPRRAALGGLSALLGGDRRPRGGAGDVVRTLRRRQPGRSVSPSV